MDAPLNNVFFPTSFNELFTTWNRFPAAVPYAGGTNILGRQENNILNLPSVFLCLDKIEELHIVTRTEQYLEIGAMVKLNRLLRLGKLVPHVLCKCIENISGVQVRNIATIGGNICSTNRVCTNGELNKSETSGDVTQRLARILDLSAPLIALDAQYELRNAGSTRWVLASRFHIEEQEKKIKGLHEKNQKDFYHDSQELLTRIRLPIYPWDYSVYKKFSSEGFYSSEAFVFLAKAQKNILSDIRIVYKGNIILRNKDLESYLNGKYLPLHRKTADDFLANWKEYLSHRPEMSEFSINAVMNNIDENISYLSE
ncbi:MAG: FAD binding domain-containing protein [Treponema sp.]|nr:FAD binding domain-containing protein [Treponema sp.]MCL2250367.1 FAD binding domain-containing protein [Treponema sp.]